MQRALLQVPNRVTAAIVAVVALAAQLVSLSPVAAQGAGAAPQPVIRSTKAGEFQPVRDGNVLSWQQNSKKRPGKYKVFARPDGEKKFRVNAKRTNGANGGIDNGILVYQQFKKSRSDLKLFDLVARNRKNPPRGVNTRQWEYWPSISGDVILFGRLMGNRDRKIVLFDLNAGSGKVLDATTANNAFLAPGQVNGDYAVWHKCPPKGACQVYRHHIPTDTTDQIPNPGSYQKSASVSPEGVVYFVRSGRGCGRSAELVRQPLQGLATVLWPLPNGADVSSTRLYDGPQGERELYYEHNDCGNATGSDIWRIVEPSTAFDLTVTKTGNGTGTVTSAPAGISCGSDCSSAYQADEQVVLTAAPAANSAFLGWSGGGCTGTVLTCTVTMDESKTVTAQFVATITLVVNKAGTGTGTVTSTPSGISCGTDCSETYASGTSVTLTAAPTTGSTFTNWTGACSGTATTCTVNMTQARSVTANFTGNRVALTVQRDLTGSATGTVVSSPVGINCAPDCTETYNFGQIVTLTASAPAGSSFTGWSGCTPDTTNTNVCSTTMDGAKTVVASFSDLPTLTISKTGTGSGTVTSQDTLINCGSDCSEDYSSGTVTLTATPSDGSTFAGWSGGGCTGTGQCTVTMDGNKTVTATFTGQTRNLALNVNGTHPGRVLGPGIDCRTTGTGGDNQGTCANQYTHGTQVTLTASGTNFVVVWSGCDAVSGDGLQCTETMDTLVEDVTATFTPAQRTLSVTKDGTGQGKIQATNPAGGIDCGNNGTNDCEQTYNHGTQVTLTATPESPDSVSWSGCDTVNSNQCTVTMNSSRGVIATFTDVAPTRHALNVTVNGTGQGRVTSSPGLIDCTTDGTTPSQGTCTDTFDEPTSVTLTANAPDGNDTWTWSGGGCTGDAATCQVTMDAQKDVTVTFTDVAGTPRLVPRSSRTGSTSYMDSIAGRGAGPTLSGSSDGGTGTVLAKFGVVLRRALSR